MIEFNFIVEKKKQKIEEVEFLYLLSLKYGKEINGFYFYGSDPSQIFIKDLSFKTIEDFLLLKKDDGLIEDYKQINVNHLQKNMIKNDQLNYDFKDGFYFQEIKKSAIPKILTLNIMNNIFNAQLKSQDLIEVENKFITETNKLIQMIKNHSFNKVKNDDKFKIFINKYKRQIKFKEEKSFLDNFNFHYLSSINNSDWKPFIEEIFPKETGNYLIPLVFTALRNDTEGFKNYLNNNEIYYFNNSHKFVNSRFIKNNTNLLHFLSFHDKPEYIDMVLTKKPELLNTLDDLNETPLFYAAKKGNIKSIEVLLKYFPDLNMENTSGEIASECLLNEPKFNQIFNKMEDQRIKNPKISKKLLI